MTKTRLLVPLALAALATACTGQTIPLAIENNTALSCVDVLQVGPASTPVAILGGTRACVAEGAYGKAAALSLLANAYGSFDAKRVADATGHQTVRLLHLQLLRQWPADARAAYSAAAQQLAVPQGPERAAFCADIRAMKEPRYYPQYMIDQGVKARRRARSQRQTASADLLPYHPQTVWADVRTHYLNCH